MFQLKTFAITMMLIASTAVTTVAQDPSTRDPQSQDPQSGQDPLTRQNPPTRQDPQTIPDPAANRAATTSTRMVRASKLIGQSLVNSSNEDVGSIHDIVLDGDTGRVRYVVVTYGGLLGIGNKLFAVPYEALTYTKTATTTIVGTDRYKHQMVLDVTKEQMQGAVGFDEDNWPDFYDTQFQTELRNRYRVQDPDRTREVPENRNPGNRIPDNQ